MKRIFILFILSLWIICTHAQTVHYVKENASGNGTSWSNASSDLQAVINSANEGDIIYVAEGTYIPSVVISSPGTDNREKSFVMKKDVKIYGGFAGNETFLDQRDWKVNQTILSGDLGTIGRNTDNSYHVVVCVGDVGTACLDGFSIKGGNSNITGTYTVNGTSINKNKGGGIFIKTSSPILSNLIITENSSKGDGGGISIDQSSFPELENILITGNEAIKNGGGIVISSNNSLVTLKNVVLSGNLSRTGGGIYVKNGGVDMINCIVSDNEAEESAGIHAESDLITITNTLIYDNTSTDYEGGGIGIIGFSPVITNSTIVNNYSESGGSGIFISEEAYPEIRNTIIYNNDVFLYDGEPVYYHSYAQGETTEDSNGNIDGSLDPMFVDADNANFRLRIPSPLVDKGNSEYVDLDIDLGSNPRISGSNIDLGAYELFTSPDDLGILYINKNVAGGIESGQNWTNAIRELSDGLIVAKNNPAVKQIWVAQGIYIPLYIQDISANDEQSRCFFMVKDVKVYGGFTGNETSFNQRDWEANSTILSGDIGVIGDNSDNSFHVVVFAGDAGIACLDGFTIKNGNANGNLYGNNMSGHSVRKIGGGGMYITNSSPKLTNLIFTENYGREGGGIYAYGFNSIMDNIYFLANNAVYGGGLNAIGSDFKIYNSLFVANNVSAGGAIYTTQNVKMIVENSLITENTASETGGGMRLGSNQVNIIINNTTITKNNAQTGGGLYLYGGITINNCIVSENVAIGGGGIYCQGDAPHPLYINNTLISGNSSQGRIYSRGGGIQLLSCSPIITNSTIVDNTATYQGNGICVPVTTNGRPSYPELRNTIVYNNDLHIDTGEYKFYNSYVQYLTTEDSNGNIDGNIDPQFVDVANADYHLKFTSPLVDKGDSSYLSEDITTDLDGNQRIAGTNIDLGVYEIKIAEPQPGVLYVNKNVVGGNGSGDSWTNAMPDLADALWNLKIRNPRGVNQIWVAQGTYIPKYTALVGDNTPRMKSFSLVKDIKVYGGFAGNEAAVEERDWENNVTVLSGDMGIAGDRSDNAFHVVVSVGDIGTASLNGFTIKDANGDNTGESLCIDGISLVHGWGGGILAHVSSPVLENLIICDNKALSGGGMRLSHNSSVINNVSIINNEVEGAVGGGIFMSSGSPLVTNSLIKGNTGSQSGGGIYVSVDCKPIFQNVVITENTSTYDGGGICYSQTDSVTLIDVEISKNTARIGGGITCYSGSGTFINTKIMENEAELGAGIYLSAAANMINVLISNNIARDNAGGIYLRGNPVILTNATIVGNSASLGSGIYCQNSSPEIRNSIIYSNNVYTTGSSINYSYSLVENITVNDANGNLDGNLNPLLDNNYNLQMESPCIDRGNASYLAGITTDLNGNSRIMGDNIDLGAFESEYASTFSINDFSEIRGDFENETFENNVEWNLNIYPNPLTIGKTAVISLENQYSYYEKTVNIELYDMTGKNFYSKTHSNGNIELHSQYLKPGVYILKLYTEEGDVFTKKLIIEN